MSEIPSLEWATRSMVASCGSRQVCKLSLPRGVSVVHAQHGGSFAVWSRSRIAWRPWYEAIGKEEGKAGQMRNKSTSRSGRACFSCLGTLAANPIVLGLSPGPSRLVHYTSAPNPTLPSLATGLPQETKSAQPAAH